MLGHSFPTRRSSDLEGDGCGLLLDLPRKIWAEEVRSGGHDPSLATDDAFAVAHVFIERSQNVEKIKHDARELLAEGGFRVLAERVGVVNSPALGPTAREEEPIFWQIGGLVPDAKCRDNVLFDLMIELEKRLDVHVPYVLGDRKSTRLNSSHPSKSRMPSSA